MDNDQKEARIAAIQDYLRTLAYPVSREQALILLDCAVGSPGVQAARDAGAAPPETQVTADGDLPLSTERMRQLAWKIDSILAVPIRLLGDLDALNDYVSERITGNPAALEDVTYEHEPQINVGKGNTALRVCGVISSPDDWFPEEADRVESEFYKGLGELAQALLTATEVHLCERGFVSRWTVADRQPDALTVLERYASTRGGSNDEINARSSETAALLNGVGVHAAGTRPLRLMDLKYAANAEQKGTWFLSMDGQPVTLVIPALAHGPLAEAVTQG